MHGLVHGMLNALVVMLAQRMMSLLSVTYNDSNNLVIVIIIKYYYYYYYKIITSYSVIFLPLYFVSLCCFEQIMQSDLNEVAVVSTDCQDVIDGVTDYLVNYSSMEDSPADDDKSIKAEDSSMEVEEADTADGLLQDATVCNLCAQHPCDGVTFGDAICEECDVMADKKFPPKMIQFHAYKLYTRLRHGVLHKFDHRPLPICVRGEIMDYWPEPDHYAIKKGVRQR